MSVTASTMNPNQQHEADRRTLHEADAAIDAATDRLIAEPGDPFWGPKVATLRRAMGVLHRKLAETRPPAKVGG